MTPISMLQDVYQQELIDACATLKNIYAEDSNADFKQIEESLRLTMNKLFEGYECIEVVITNNTDKPLFGVKVNPTITDSDILNIIVSDSDIQLTRYSLEIDLKLLENLNESELAAYLVEEVASIMDYSTIQKTRALLDTLLTNSDESINIRQSINYNQLMIFGIKDTMYKVSSLLYKPEEEIGKNQYATEFGLYETLYGVMKQIKSYTFDKGEAMDAPTLGVLQWVLNIYTEIHLTYRLAEETLNNAYAIEGSELMRREIDKTLKAIRRAVNEVVTEETIVEELSIFKSLKQNGLRSLEDDLYEFKIRVKTAESEEDVIYVLRQLNTRIAILDDYLDDEDISDADRDRWSKVERAYRILREECGKNKVYKKKSNYGVFVDYDAIDNLG